MYNHYWDIDNDGTKDDVDTGDQCQDMTSYVPAESYHYMYTQVNEMQNNLNLCESDVLSLSHKNEVLEGEVLSLRQELLTMKILFMSLEKRLSICEYRPGGPEFMKIIQEEIAAGIIKV